MYKIYIDTTQRYEKSIKITNVANNEVVAEVSGDLDIVPEIQNLLQVHNIEIKDVQEIIPSVGPGSFTGIKIGLAIANVFNWAKGAKDSVKEYKPEYGKEPNIQQ